MTKKEVVKELRSLSGLCPYARGCDPYDLTCSLAVAKDADLPWWRRIVRVLAGRYICPHPYGELPIGVTGNPVPCERFDLTH